MAHERSDHVDELIAQWERERPELPTGALALAARIVRLQRFLDQRVDASLAPLGLSRGHVNVLATLRRSGPPHELTPTELYRGLLLSSGAMTNRIDQLEDRGLVRRIPDERDRRRTRVALTPQGLAAVDEAMDVHVRHLEDQLDFLASGDRDQLSALLRRMLIEFEHGVAPGSEPPGSTG